jgi:hypothetical protein
MTQMFRIRLMSIPILAIMLVWHDAGAWSWGVAAGPSRALKHEWALGFCTTGHVQCGIETTVSYWRPASTPPSGKVGVDWESSGVAWLFEIGPAIRLATRPLDEYGGAFVWYYSSGLVLVSSDAELYAHVAGSSMRMEQLNLIDSRAAPYIQMGVGLLSAGDQGLRLELLAKGHVLFAKPELTGAVAVELGVAFF